LQAQVSETVGDEVELAEGDPRVRLHPLQFITEVEDDSQTIGLTNYVPSLLHDMRNRLILVIIQIHPSWFALISTLVDRVNLCEPSP
jgi:hypothetical protein